MRRHLVDHLVEQEGARLRTTIKDPEALARGIGVTLDVLKQAVRLARVAYANEHVAVIRNMNVLSPAPIRRHVLAAGAHYGFPLGDYTTFLRSLFHAVMQTSFEPMVRGHSLRRYQEGLRRYGVALDPHPKGHRLKLIPVSQFTSRGGDVTLSNHQRIRINKGLYDALKERARAYGKTSATYGLLWLLDAIDGLLPKALIFEPVRFKDLFPRAENYVLPVKPLSLRRLSRSRVQSKGTSP